MQLADKIRIIRKARGLSQEGLGFSLSRVSENGISRQAVSDWETGKSEPKLENIRDLAEVLGVSFDALLDESIDLDNPDVLTAVLTKQKYAQIEVEEKSNESNIVNKSIGYDIKINTMSAKKFKLTITTGIFLILTAISGALITKIPLAWIITLILGYCALLLSIFAITNEIIAVKKGRMTLSVGHISYHKYASLNGFSGNLTIDDKYIKMDDYEDSGNNICIPINRIVDIKLGEGTKKKHGDVLVEIKDRDNPMIIFDIMQPQNLIDTFKKIKTEIEKNTNKE